MHLDEIKYVKLHDNRMCEITLPAPSIILFAGDNCELWMLHGSRETVATSLEAGATSMEAVATSLEAEATSLETVCKTFLFCKMP